MVKIMLVFALVALVNIATALDCNSCNPCVIGQNYTKVLACGKSTDPKTEGGACLKHTYIDKDTNKEVTEKDCITGKKNAGGVVEHKCSEAKGKNIFCEICFTDYCNSGSFLQISLVSLFASYVILKLA